MKQVLIEAAAALGVTLVGLAVASALTSAAVVLISPVAGVIVGLGVVYLIAVLIIWFGRASSALKPSVNKGGSMSPYKLAELESLPTLSVSQADDLKVDTGIERIWLSRCGVIDGEPYDHKVTVERLLNGCWIEVQHYPAA